jgi:hypothetical protein
MAFNATGWQRNHMAFNATWWHKITWHSMPPDDITLHSMPPDDIKNTWHSMPPDDKKLHDIQCHLMTKKLHGLQKQIIHIKCT